MSDEKKAEVVGNYLIVSWREQSSAPENPLESDEYAGQLHGNFSDWRQQWGSFGDKYEFQRARGNLDSDGNLDYGDYREQAALMVIAETSFEDAVGALVECAGWDAEELDDVRANVMHAFGSYVMEEYNRSWPKLPDDMQDAITEKAEALALADVEARAAGNKYAVPMSVSGQYTMQLEPDLHKDIAEMDKSDLLWVPSNLAVEDLDKLPYTEAMEKAVASAKSDGEDYANWASNEVYDAHVVVYRLEFDEDDDDEPITDPDFYEDEGCEEELDEHAHECLGSDYADERLEALIKEAKEWVAEQEPEEPSARSSSPSMSM